MTHLWVKATTECLAKWKRPKEGMSLWNLTATQMKTLRAFGKTEEKKKANTVDHIHKMRNGIKLLNSNTES